MASPSTPSSAPSSAGGVQLTDLQSILRNMNVPEGAPASAAASARVPCDLSEAMKPEDLIPMLCDEKVRESLVAHLPDAANIPKTEAELKETIHSPQFQQACSATWSPNAVSWFNSGFQICAKKPVRTANLEPWIYDSYRISVLSNKF